MTFPEKLITLRAGRGWSQEKLAGELGADNCRRGADGYAALDGGGYLRAALAQVQLHRLGHKLALAARHRRIAAGAGGKA